MAAALAAAVLPPSARDFGKSSARRSPVGAVALMGESGVPPGERTLMVGDSYVDLLTARSAGARVAGSTYGFQPESFVEHPAGIYCASMIEVAD